MRWKHGDGSGGGPPTDKLELEVFELIRRPAKFGIFWVKIRGGGLRESYLVELD